jgi:hypothetical protein
LFAKQSANISREAWVKTPAYSIVQEVDMYVQIRRWLLFLIVAVIMLSTLAIAEEELFIGTRLVLKGDTSIVITSGKMSIIEKIGIYGNFKGQNDKEVFDLASVSCTPTIVDLTHEAQYLQDPERTALFKYVAKHCGEEIPQPLVAAIDLRNLEKAGYWVTGVLVTTKETRIKFIVDEGSLNPKAGFIKVNLDGKIGDAEFPKCENPSALRDYLADKCTDDKQLEKYLKSASR